MLDPEKLEIFQALVTWPLPSVALCSDIKNNLEKVFSPTDSIDQFAFIDPQDEKEFKAYRQSINEPEFWQDEFWRAYWVDPDALIAVDLPPVPVSGSRAEPYFFLVPTDNVIDYEFIGYKKLDWVIFSHDKDSVYVYDSYSYRSFKFGARGELTLEVESFHGLGYAPIQKMLSKRITQFRRKMVISDLLGDLDNYVWDSVGLKHLKSFTGYPSVTTYEQECTYESPEGFRCENGWVNSYEEDGHTHSSRTPCPECSTQKSWTFGSVFWVPMPQPDGAQKAFPAIEVTKGDTESIRELRIDLKGQEEMIVKKASGVLMDTAKEAINEKQVGNMAESRVSILQSLAKEITRSKKFVLDTMARLRYGANFQGSVVNWGTKFLDISLKEAEDSYSQGKTAGMPDYVLAEKRRKMIEQKIANDPESSARLKILSDLEPQPGRSVKEVMDLNYVISKTDKIYKAYFEDFIVRFELENGAVEAYRRELKYEKKIDDIKSILKRYLNEKLTEFSTDSEKDGGGPGRGDAPEDNPKREDRDLR